MTIKFRNEALQYLYILTSKISADSIAKIRKVKAVFLKLQPTVEGYERKWEELAAQAETSKMTLDGWKQTNQLEKHKAEVENLTNEIKANTDAVKTLKATEVEAELNGDDVAFLMEEIDKILSTPFIGQDGNTVSGIQGKREIDIFDEVYTTLENSKQ